MLRERLYLEVPHPQFAVLVAVLIQAVAGGYFDAVEPAVIPDGLADDSVAFRGSLARRTGRGTQAAAPGGRE